MCGFLYLKMTFGPPTFSGQEAGQKGYSALRRAYFPIFYSDVVKERKGKGRKRLEPVTLEKILWGVNPRLLIKDTSFSLSPMPSCLPSGISELLWTSECSVFSIFFHLQMRVFICLSCLFCTILCCVHVEKIICLLSSE